MLSVELGAMLLGPVSLVAVRRWGVVAGRRRGRGGEFKLRVGMIAGGGMSCVLVLEMRWVLEVLVGLWSKLAAVMAPVIVAASVSVLVSFGLLPLALLLVGFGSGM